MPDEKRRRFPFDLLERPLNPLELVDRLEKILIEIDKTARELDKKLQSIDSVLTGFSREFELKKPESKETEEVIKMKKEDAEAFFKELNKLSDTASKAIDMISGGKLSNAAKFLAEASENQSCAACGEIFKKAALQIGLAITAKRLGETDWEKYISEAKTTLNKVSKEIVPKLKRTIVVEE